MSTTSSTNASDSSAANALPVAVIGAGPVGLAAAAHLLARGETPLVLEAGERVGPSIRQWRHVKFFSPWKYTVDPASVALLEPTGWTMPDPESAPTGWDIVERYMSLWRLCRRSRRTCVLALASLRSPAAATTR